MTSEWTFWWQKQSQSSVTGDKAQEPVKVPGSQSEHLNKNAFLTFCTHVQPSTVSMVQAIKTPAGLDESGEDKEDENES
jgi:hypothetical protein